jgi:hypothetical protein
MSRINQILVGWASTPPRIYNLNVQLLINVVQAFSRDGLEAHPTNYYQ